MDRLEKILSKVKEIPTLPSQVATILSLIENPHSHILKISEVIQQDFTLSVRILKMANSAYYARSKKIITVLEAIVLLGLNTVKELVVASSTYDILSRKVIGYLLEKGDLWNHSLCCAISSEIISKECLPSLMDKAYIAGLLHDVGKLILAHYVEEDFLKIIDKVEKEKVPFDTAEEEIIGFSHAKLGGELLKKWHFPDEIIEAIEYHHNPENAKYFDLSSIVHIADAVSLMLGAGLGVDGLLYSLKDFSFEPLRLKKEKLEEILGKTADAFNSINKIL